MAKKTIIGIDLGIKPSWWKRLLVWLKIKKRDWDYTCIATYEDKNGTKTLKDLKYL